MKHTKGPWKNDYEPSTGFGCGYGKSQIIAADGQAVAGVAAVKPSDGSPMYEKGGFSKATMDTLEANAKLIASAPELLEALKKAITNVLTDPVQCNGEWETGLFCGLEDRNITDRYQACRYGYDRAIEKVQEWIISELEQAIAKAEGGK